MPSYSLEAWGKNDFLHWNLTDKNLLRVLKSGRSNHLMEFGTQRETRPFKIKQKSKTIK